MVKLVLFDIDSCVHTGHAGTQAFAKTFATEFKLHHGSEKMKFAGRTDVSLVREFFRIHECAETPEHFAQFFERYVFWLDQILSRSHTQICPGDEALAGRGRAPADRAEDDDDRAGERQAKGPDRGRARHLRAGRHRDRPGFSESPGSTRRRFAETRVIAKPPRLVNIIV